MNYGLLFFQFLPLLAYILVDYVKGFRAGVFAALAATVIMLIWNYTQFGEIDRFSLGESLLIVILGVVSLKMNSEKIFKFQPVVVSLICGIIFFYFQWFDEPLMVRYIPQIEKLFASQSAYNPEFQSLLLELHSPGMLAKLSSFSFIAGCTLLGHAAFMYYAALKCSTRKWFAWRLSIYPSLFLAMLIAISAN